MSNLNSGAAMLLIIFILFFSSPASAQIQTHPFGAGITDESGKTYQSLQEYNQAAEQRSTQFQQEQRRRFEERERERQAAQERELQQQQQQQQEQQRALEEENARRNQQAQPPAIATPQPVPPAQPVQTTFSDFREGWNNFWGSVFRALFIIFLIAVFGWIFLMVFLNFQVAQKKEKEKREAEYNAHLSALNKDYDQRHVAVSQLSKMVTPDHLPSAIAAALAAATLGAIALAKNRPGTIEGMQDAINEQKKFITNLSESLDGFEKKESEPPIEWLKRFTEKLAPVTSGEAFKNDRAVIGHTSGEQIAPIALTPEQRSLHTYVIGKTGSGKTTLLKNLIAQDFAKMNHEDDESALRDRSVVVISPENGIFEALFAYLPPGAERRLIYFEPTDTTEPVIGFNPFHLEAGDDITQKAGETYTILARALGDIGVKMTTLLQNAVYALLYLEDATMLDLERLLHPRNPTLRRQIEHTNADERTKTFWEQYDTSGYYKSAYEPIINRLDPFLRPPLSDTLSISSFSFSEILNGAPHIFFANLSKLRGIQAELTGQLLFAQIQQTLFHRDGVPAGELLPCSIFIDEFQTYASHSETSLAELLARSRKYKVGLTLANQVTADIPSKLLSQIVGNVGTVVALQLASEDAPFFAKELQIKDRDGHQRPEWLQNLKTGQAYVRTPGQNSATLVSIPILPPLNHFDPHELKQQSKANYGVKTLVRPAPAKRQTKTSDEDEGELKQKKTFVDSKESNSSSFAWTDGKSPGTIDEKKKHGQQRRTRKPTDGLTIEKALKKPTA